jgi:hypothetical protein
VAISELKQGNVSEIRMIEIKEIARNEDRIKGGRGDG